MLLTGLLAFLLSSIIGALLAVLFYRIPVRVVVGLEGHLHSYKDSLENLVKQRTEQLEVITEKNSSSKQG